MAKILRKANTNSRGKKPKKLYKRRNVIRVITSPTANSIFMATIK